LCARGTACEWKKRNVAGALDGFAEPALMARADAGHAARQDLAALLYELRQDVSALIVDEVHFLDAKFADFLFAEILALAAAWTAWAAARTAWAAFTARTTMTSTRATVTAAWTVSATAWSAGSG